MNVPCEVCGAPGTHWKRCDVHYHCDGCGTTSNIVFYGRDWGLRCDDCKEKLAKDKIASFAGDTEAEDIVICPHCGEIYTETWEYEDGSTYECEFCGRGYVVHQNITITISTYKEGEA